MAATLSMEYLISCVNYEYKLTCDTIRKVTPLFRKRQDIGVLFLYKGVGIVGREDVRSLAVAGNRKPFRSLLAWHSSCGRACVMRWDEPLQRMAEAET